MYLCFILIKLANHSSTFYFFINSTFFFFSDFKFITNLIVLTRTNAWVVSFQNVPLGTMAQAAILIVLVRTVEFAAGFLEAASASRGTMEETVNTVNRK